MPTFLYYTRPLCSSLCCCAACSGPKCSEIKALPECSAVHCIRHSHPVGPCPRWRQRGCYQDAGGALLPPAQLLLPALGVRIHSLNFNYLQLFTTHQNVILVNYNAQGIGCKENIPNCLARAKDKSDPFRLMGFGHRVRDGHSICPCLVRIGYRAVHCHWTAYMRACSVCNHLLTNESRVLWVMPGVQDVRSTSADYA